MANPVIPVEGAKDEEPSVAAISAAEPAVEGAAPSTSTETPVSPTPHETAPKANKRNSIFGNLFSKKETAVPTATTNTNEVAPVVPAKDTEPAPISHLDPQPENAVTESAPVADTTTPATTTTETAPATTSTTSPLSSDTTKANRRSSFFSNLGTKKEKRTGGVSDAEGTDGEGKKSGGFGGLLRKASRAQGGRSSSKAAPTTEGAADAEAPAPISKDTAATEASTHGAKTTRDIAADSTTTASQQTAVQAAA